MIAERNLLQQAVSLKDPARTGAGGQNPIAAVRLLKELFAGHERTHTDCVDERDLAQIEEELTYRLIAEPPDRRLKFRSARKVEFAG